jgi:hypothetical protein
LSLNISSSFPIDTRALIKRESIPHSVAFPDNSALLPKLQAAVDSVGHKKQEAKKIGPLHMSLALHQVASKAGHGFLPQGNRQKSRECRK